MKRREFLSSSVAGAMIAAEAASAKQQIPRRRYKDNVELSIIGFGGIVVNGQDQEVGNRQVAASFERGVNYFDVAPSYGDGEAEIKLGNALIPFRKEVFLACKTTQRKAEGARMELERSLQRLHTDHFDLYQFHAVTSMQDVEQILGPGGAAEVFLKARQEGKARFLGCSAHSEEAALALIEKFPLDSILFPVNFVCFAEGNFGPRIIAKAKEKGIARLALKALAHQQWPEGTNRRRTAHPKCWYEPIADEALASKALRFTLSEDITAAVPPGDEKIYEMALKLAMDFKPLTAAEREQLLASAKGLKPVFHSA